LLGYLAALLIAYGLILLAARLFEKKIIFFPDYPGRLDGDWHPNALPVEDVWISTGDGVKLHAWWIPNPSAKFTFLAFHGNASNIAGRAEVYRFLSQLPANVLAIEYRGYGRSEGTPSETGLYLDAQAGYDYALNTLNIPPERIISFGQSLGTAVAVDLAARRHVAGVVLEAPFPSTWAVARRVYPYLPGVGLVAKSKFNTAEKIERIHAPVLIVHCVQDPVIAYSLGEQVYQRALSPKFFLRIDGVCHEEASLIAPARYRQQLLDFLSGIAPVK
jgi:hypothetical protein